MPGIRCAVSSCKNSLKKTKLAGKRISYHRFPVPKNQESLEIRKIWIERCGRVGKWNPSTNNICSVHFADDDYERDLQHELLNLPLRKRLKKTAVPSLHLGNAMGRDISSGKNVDVQEVKRASDEQTKSSKKKSHCDENIQKSKLDSNLCVVSDKSSKNKSHCDGTIQESNLDSNSCVVSGVKRNEVLNKENNFPKNYCNSEFVLDATLLLKKCRLCLLNMGKFPISADGLSQQISKYVQVELFETPNDPASICLSCKTFLKTMDSFVARVNAANLELRSHINNASKANTLTDKLNVKIDIVKQSKYEIPVSFPSGNFKCEFCGERFIRSSHYRRHKKTHPLLYICNQAGCRRTFTIERSFKRHLYNHSRQREIYKLAFKQGKYSCRLCKKNFINARLLRQHRETHVNFKCVVVDCNVILKSWKHFDKHMLQHENTKKALCQVCGKTFRTYKLLYQHQRIHSGVRYKCEFCDVSYAKKTSLTEHTAVKHKGVRFYCSMCPNSYANRTRLTYHEKVHKAEKDFQCTLCPKSFFFRRNLNLHIQGHQGIKRHQCSVCLKSFVLKQTLKNHEKLHNVERHIGDGVRATDTK